MFGVLRGIYLIAAGCYSKIRYYVLNNESKKEFYRRNTDTYINPRGECIEKRTGKRVSFRRNENGDLCEVYSKDGTVIKNFTKEIRDIEYKKSLNDKSKTVFLVRQNTYTGKKCPFSIGKVTYIDKITNKYVFEYRYKGIGEKFDRYVYISAYFDIATGEFIRLSDTTTQSKNDGYITEKEVDIIVKSMIKVIKDYNDACKYNMYI